MRDSNPSAHQLNLASSIHICHDITNAAYSTVHDTARYQPHLKSAALMRWMPFCGTRRVMTAITGLSGFSSSPRPCQQQQQQRQRQHQREATCIYSLTTHHNSVAGLF
jgi:hypothetical protein